MAEQGSCDMRGKIFTGASLIALVTLLGGPQSADAAGAPDKMVPVFEVDSHFPTMPEHRLLGGVGGATADSHGNVWVFHRPHTLEEGNATENGYKPAPPVLEFGPAGQYLR